MLYSGLMLPESSLSHLECPACGRKLNADQLQTFCIECCSPLLARYDLDALRHNLRREQIKARPRGLWRWAELLPVRRVEHRLTLGEGDTPLLPASHLGERLGLKNLLIKDESVNPTGSFKARGFAVAVGRAMELGQIEFVVPTAGNAGGALAFYAARGKAKAHVFMPADAPHANQEEVRLSGADMRLVDGLINRAAQLAGDEAKREGWFDMSTFKEPYRVEGKKTMGLELAEAFGWDLPEVIVYPTGGGTGLVGMWKAFDELQSLGWVGDKRPRMVSVQSDGCAPVVRAFWAGTERIEPWEAASTVAAGLRVPALFADKLVLEALHASHGSAVAVSDKEIMDAQRELSRTEGIFAAPEGAATLAGLYKLVDQKWMGLDDRIVLFNTGTGLKYI